MLIVAFARDILDRIKIEPLRDLVEEEVLQRLTRGSNDGRTAQV